MKHIFDVSVAEKYGLVESILLENLFYWARKNSANEKHFHDGRYWTYNSRKAFARLFPYMGEKSIERALNHLVGSGILMKGNYNTDKFDRTSWFAFTDLGESIMAETVDFSDTDNLSTSTGQNVQSMGQDVQSTGQIDPTIPDINNTDINIPVSKQEEEKTDTNVSAKKKFVPPTSEEVEEYCQEMGYGIDPDAFIDHYTTTGWMYGKTHMKDWKSAVRTWERRRKSDKKTQKKSEDDFYERLRNA